MIISLFAFFLFGHVAYSAPSTPVITESDWRTGEIMTTYSNVTVGNVITLYARQYTDDSWVVWDIWTATASSGTRVSKHFENGQTVWYKISQTDLSTGEESGLSNEYKITPPITAFIINWPEMFGELSGLFERLNNELIDALENLATPSDSAMDDLTNALNGMKDALGVGSAESAGAGLQDGLNTIGGGLKPPMVVDDGDGTYTGGDTGGDLPFPDQTGGTGLISPNPDSGESTELTMRIPYGVDMQGNLLYLRLFTKEQMEKMKWLGLLRTLASATLYIMFAFWLVSRMAPQLKS